MLSNKSITKNTKNNKEMPELITLQEACDILKCHHNTLRQWDKKGILVAVPFWREKRQALSQRRYFEIIKPKEKMT
ncbi:MAG TPA: hypothetical protein P5570_01030 [Candidatus Paceibacterota bacterium]|mgnify:CR=1 FL=1|jgi:predicted site-specific integrase-resolvase|nr:hypothetical protein [Candidatus Paceibacterota bacterium]